MSQIKRVNPESLRIPTKSYSQGVLIPLGDTELMFVTGQLSQDIDGNVVGVGDIKKQTEVVFSRLSEILKEAGMSLDDVVKVQIFVKDIKDAKIISKMRDDLFKISRPASTLVEVSNFVKDDCLVEIEVTAARIK